MNLQSLVLCSDEKIVRVLRRVLNDLEIAVDQSAYPDSASRSRYNARQSLSCHLKFGRMSGNGCADYS